MREKLAGYFKLFSARKVPIYIHWSFPLGGLFISLFAGFDPQEAVYFSVAFLLLIAIHELGHVAAARLLGLEVFAVDISGIGGQCRLQLPTKTWEVFLIYSAGIFAQMVLLALTVFQVMAFGMPTFQFGLCLVQTFIFVNFLMLVINIIPGKAPGGLANDGYVLWKLFLYGVDDPRFPDLRMKDVSPIFPEETRLISRKGFKPKNFLVGVEILNDNRTPMDLVVHVLTTHLQMQQDEAAKVMLEIHRKGGKLISLPDLETAEIAATAITADSHERGFNLICRAVDGRIPVQSKRASFYWPW